MPTRSHRPMPRTRCRSGSIGTPGYDRSDIRPLSSEGFEFNKGWASVYAPDRVSANRGEAAMKALFAIEKFLVRHFGLSLISWIVCRQAGVKPVTTFMLTTIVRKSGRH